MFILKLAIGLLAACFSAIFYRAGGMGKEAETKPTWIPIWLRHSWCRDWICPTFSLLTLLLFWQPQVWWGWLLLLLSYGLMGGAFSTYWDFLFKDKDNFYMHGFMIGLSIFPLCFVGLAWWIVLIQAILSGLSMGLWCKYFGNDVVEEMGRGFFSSIFRLI